MQESINIVYITDEGYAMPTCVSMLSLIMNMDKDDRVNIFVICDSLSKKAKECFLSLRRENVCIELVEVEWERYRQLAKENIRTKYTHVTGTALYKFSLSEMLRDLEKVIYLDGDTVIQKSLNALYNYNLGDNYVAAVNDIMDESIGEYSKMANRIGLKRRGYFNSGVMLLNLKKMREDSIVHKLFTYRENCINYFMDQDALNAVLGENRIILPYKYNLLSTVTDAYEVDKKTKILIEGKEVSVEECIRTAIILHITGKQKCWEYNVPWYSEIFFRYYKRSPYANEKVVLKSLIKQVSYLENRIRWYEDKITNYKLTRGYIVPYEKIEPGCRLVLYGAGNVGKSYYAQFILTRYCTIVLWVDQNVEIQDYQINSPFEILQTEYDYVLIAIENCKTVMNVKHFLTTELNVKEDRVISAFGE